MKLSVSHYPGASTVAEEFALIRFARAKRLGLPVPRSVVNLLSEPTSRDGESRRAFALRLGVSVGAVVYRLGQLGMTRAQVSDWAGSK